MEVSDIPPSLAEISPLLSLATTSFHLYLLQVILRNSLCVCKLEVYQYFIDNTHREPVLSLVKIGDSTLRRYCPLAPDLHRLLDA